MLVCPLVVHRVRHLSTCSIFEFLIHRDLFDRRDRTAKVFLDFVPSRGRRQASCLLSFTNRFVYYLLLPAFHSIRSTETDSVIRFFTHLFLLLFSIDLFSRPPPFIFFTYRKYDLSSPRLLVTFRSCAGKENEYFMETDRYWGVHYRYCPALRIDLKEGRRVPFQGTRSYRGSCD